jgi:hypothetical protein
VAKIEERLWLHIALDHELCYKETEGPIMIVFSIICKCKGPFQVTNSKGAEISVSMGPVTQNYL